MIADQTSDVTTIDGGRGGVCNTKMGGVQGAASNEGASALDLPGDLAPSRYTDGTTESREGQHYRDKKGETGVPKSSAGG